MKNETPKHSDETGPKKPGNTSPKKPFDPQEQAIKFKAFRYIFSQNDIEKGLDEKKIAKKLKKSKSLENRYQYYLKSLEESENSKASRTYPWRNPFNKVLYWATYWLNGSAKWGTLAFLILFLLNYIPGPTQHTVELMIARSIYDTAPLNACRRH